MTWNKLDRTGTPIIDRRTEDTGEPSAEDKASDERDRLARREDIKHKIGVHTLELERANLLRAEVQRINAVADQAADSHSAICGPLQEELERLEQSAIARIAARQPANKKEDARRAEIIHLIEEQNEILTEATEKAKRLRQPLEGRIEKLQIDAAPLDSLRGKLASIGIGDPALIVEHHCTQQRASFASARLAAAKKALSIVSYNVEQIAAGRMHGDLAAQQFRVRRWAAEVDAAGQEQADAMAAGSRIHAAMIAE